MPEDSALIKPEFRSLLSIQRVENSKARRPVSTFTIGDIFVIRYEFENFNGAINQISVKAKSGISRDNGISYRVLRGPFFEFNFTLRKLEKADSLSVYFHGDSFNQIIKKDSVLSLSFVCNNMGIKFQDDLPFDIFLEGDSRAFWFTRKIPLNIIFVKKNSGLTMLVCTSKREGLAPNDVFEKFNL